MGRPDPRIWPWRRRGQKVSILSDFSIGRLRFGEGRPALHMGPHLANQPTYSANYSMRNEVPTTLWNEVE